MSQPQQAVCSAGCGSPAGRWEGLCSTCGNLLAGMCFGKRRHWSARYAAKAARTFGDEQREYRCLVCGSYHVGGKGRHTDGINEERARVVTGLRRAGNASILTKLAGQWDGMNRNEWKARRSDG